jgi:hypothetical protein
MATRNAITTICAGCNRNRGNKRPGENRRGSLLEIDDIDGGRSTGLRAKALHPRALGGAHSEVT